MKKLLIGFVVVVLAGLGFWKMTAKPAESPKPLEEVPPIEVTEKDWIRGPKDAPITLVEYGDFQCPSCAAYYSILKQLENEFPDKLRVVFRQFPLTTIHNQSFGAAVTAEAAGRQGKFWEMHDLLFEKQDEWVGKSKFDEYAGNLGLDIKKFKADLDLVEAKVRVDQKSGLDLKVSGTPTFFLNGQKIGLPGSFEQFKVIMDGEIAKLPPPEKVHMHFDIAVYIDGKKIDLSQEKYMEKNESVHLHDNNGEVAHIHVKGATLGMFIESLGLKPDSNPQINNEVISDWENYEPQDLDRIVFGAGPVTDKACIYSETCPERGKPPTEKCVGGANTPCE